MVEESMLNVTNLDALSDDEMEAAAFLFTTMATYCVFGRVARIARKAGNVATALEYERRMEVIYDSLPPQARW